MCCISTVQSHKILYWVITLSHPDHSKPERATDYYKSTPGRSSCKTLKISSANTTTCQEYSESSLLKRMIEWFGFSQVIYRFNQLRSIQCVDLIVYAFTISGLQGWLFWELNTSILAEWKHYFFTSFFQLNTFLNSPVLNTDSMTTLIRKTTTDKCMHLFQCRVCSARPVAWRCCMRPLTARRRRWRRHCRVGSLVFFQHDCWCSRQPEQRRRHWRSLYWRTSPVRTDSSQSHPWGESLPPIQRPCHTRREIRRSPTKKSGDKEKLASFL